MLCGDNCFEEGGLGKEIKETSYNVCSIFQQRALLPLATLHTLSQVCKGQHNFEHLLTSPMCVLIENIYKDAAKLFRG